MFNLRIVQANFGDCFIVEYGSNTAPGYILIDGGPEAVFNRNLESEIRAIGASGGRLDLVAISHVDGDHITGLLDLLATLRDQRTNGQPEGNPNSSELVSFGTIASPTLLIMTPKLRHC
jgi:glyoxylase-like metal-dependent hydrolase (beta-lactamase superfamily II)